MNFLEIKNQKKYLQFSKSGDNHLSMNQRSPDKVNITAWFERQTAKRVRKMASQQNLDVSSFVRRILQDATFNIELTPDDYKEIAKETKRAALRISRQRNKL